jgi:hypothetical protein
MLLRDTDSAGVPFVTHSSHEGRGDCVHEGNSSVSRSSAPKNGFQSGRIECFCASESLLDDRVWLFARRDSRGRSFASRFDAADDLDKLRVVQRCDVTDAVPSLRCTVEEGEALDVGVGIESLPSS